MFIYMLFWNIYICFEKTQQFRTDRRVATKAKHRRAQIPLLQQPKWVMSESFCIFDISWSWCSAEISWMWGLTFRALWSSRHSVMDKKNLMNYLLLLSNGSMMTRWVEDTWACDAAADLFRNERNGCKLHKDGCAVDLLARTFIFSWLFAYRALWCNRCNRILSIQMRKAKIDDEIWKYRKVMYSFVFFWRCYIGKAGMHVTTNKKDIR